VIDVMKVRYATPEGKRADRYAVNVTSFGMGGTVAERVNRSSKPLGAVFAFLAATLQTALTFSGKEVLLRVDDSKTLNVKITNVAVGNGQYHGAGMWICPGAIIDDGHLDVTVVKHLGLPELVRNIPVLYNGGILSHPKVESYRVKNLVAESDQTVLLEIDGEALGRLPVEISVVPSAIRAFFP
jgi:diacylglycerol kinase family enzyme